MCIVFFEWTEDRFLVCHNRDELFSRPTTSTWWWPKRDNNNNDDSKNDERFSILAPRDDKSGGTWFGFEETTGRCAFLTNIREIDRTKYSSSRGEFVVNYLTSDPKLSALEYLEREFGGGDSTTSSSNKEYAGFNLVVFSGRDLAYVSNRYPKDQAHTVPISLSKGIPYGLSNSVLQEPYAKVRSGLEKFQQILADHQSTSSGTADLMDKLEALMQRTDYCPGDPLPKTGEPGFPEAIVKQRSSICVPDSGGYGTRTTIRFVLERPTNTNETDSKEEEKPQPPTTTTQWRLRCIEKNWNPATLAWDTSVDLEDTLALR
jgi:uncharacterized protein with NRDE domain